MSNKIDLGLVPIEALEAGAAAFEDGSKKYGRNSFKTLDQDWSICIASLLRHVHAFANGEDVAEDSGVSHLGHAIARCSMLLYWQKNSIGTDDRLCHLKKDLTINSNNNKVKPKAIKPLKPKKASKGAKHGRKSI